MLFRVFLTFLAARQKGGCQFFSHKFVSCETLMRLSSLQPKFKATNTSILKLETICTIISITLNQTLWSEFFVCVWGGGYQQKKSGRNDLIFPYIFIIMCKNKSERISDSYLAVFYKNWVPISEMFFDFDILEQFFHYFPNCHIHIYCRVAWMIETRLLFFSLQLSVLNFM